MHPFRFIKAHPLGFTASAATGMIAGPFALNFLRRTTGVGINLPSYKISRG
jgi:hypothetical protein